LCITVEGATVMRDPVWFPPHSPHGLLQESVWPDEWLTILICIMLNCTSRKQVENVLPEFIRRWPTVSDVCKADIVEVSDVIKSLGFANRRSNNIKSCAAAFCSTTWTDIRQLPGCGEYAGRCHDIFFKGELSETEPDDGALKLYWRWYKKNVRAV
jgi:methyl-CpG-binding domain protein 4